MSAAVCDRCQKDRKVFNSKSPWPGQKCRHCDRIWDHGRRVWRLQRAMEAFKEAVGK